MASGPFTLARLAHAVGMSAGDVRSFLEDGLLQPPRRHRRRPDDLTFHAEHVERLQFIKRALECGFKSEDVARLVDREALLTCGDISEITNRRIAALHAEGRGETREAVCLQQLHESCSGIGGRMECKIIEGLAGPNL